MESIYLEFTPAAIEQLRVLQREASARHADYIQQCDGAALIGECALVLSILEPMLECVDDGRYVSAYAIQSSVIF